MRLSNIPGKLVLPFANAGGKSTIPVASQIGITAGAASLTDGFPPLTRTPIAAGGVPPSGLDMNGILYEMSAIIRWANAGGGYPFDGTFAADTNVDGYPKGARVMRSDGQGYWLNTAENNITNPEGAGAVAAGWVPDYSHGAATVTMTSANVSLTPSQWGKPVIVITGILTADLNLVFPDIVGQWQVINSTTGSFTITAKTATGVGVALVAGINAVTCDSSSFFSGAARYFSAIGSSLIGFLQSGVGAVKRAVQDVLRERVSVFDYMTAAQIVAVQTNTWATVSDVSDPIDVAIAANPGRKIKLPKGHYKVVRTVVLPFVDYTANPGLSDTAVTLCGEGGFFKIFNRTKIFGDIIGPVIQMAGVFVGPGSLDFIATIGHCLQNMTVENTSVSATTSIGVQTGYIYCPNIVNVEIIAKAIPLDLGNWSMVSNLDNVSLSGGEIALSANACWGSSWKNGRAFYNKVVARITSSDFYFDSLNAEHNKIVYNMIGCTFSSANAHIEDFDCLYTNEMDALAQISGGYVGAGTASGNGDYPSLVKLIGGHHLGWTQLAPFFVTRPTTLGAISTFDVSGLIVDTLTAPNQITVAGAFNDKTPVNQGRFLFANNYPAQSFLFYGQAAGARQGQYSSSITDQIDSGNKTNHFVSKLRVGSLNSTMSNTFYPAHQSVAAGVGAKTTWTRTILGAQPLDFVMYSHGSNNANLIVTAYVSAADTVTVTAVNTTASTQGLGDNSESIVVLQGISAGIFSDI